MPKTSAAARSLPELIRAELLRVEKRAARLHDRESDLSTRERAELHALWSYQQRLPFLHVLAAICQPEPPSEREMAALGAEFRRAIVAYGSASDDNIDAAATVKLTIRPDLSSRDLCIGSAAAPLSTMLLAACDVIGSDSFFRRHLAAEPDCARIAPQEWERAYRVLMLFVDAMLRCPDPSGPRRKPRPRTRAAPKSERAG